MVLKLSEVAFHRMCADVDACVDVDAGAYVDEYLHALTEGWNQAKMTDLVMQEIYDSTPLLVNLDLKNQKYTTLFS